ncbi:MAG: WecB/TagA/CpsF family glycosyltransferase [Candidatus Omnitrophica bacterium]|nr:WecB/TagA/CpsF family glycosyltransferase [Candidatus Omnitrophota bacterium]
MIILNVRYDNLTREEGVDRIVGFLKVGKKANVFFLNADCLYKTKSDKIYADILDKADLVLPDGIGVQLTTRLFGGEMKANCIGTDFCPILMEKLAKEGYKVFFLGGAYGVAEKAAKNILKKIPGLKIVGTHNGYFKEDEEVVEKINNSGADAVFVARGVPLQEKWIYKNREHINAGVCLGVGALLDLLSGRVKRAPLWMRKIHLEWLGRLIIEPGRLFKRYMIDGFFFVVYVFVFWLKNHKKS